MSSTSSASSPVPFEGDYSFVNVVTDGTWPDSWGKPPKTRKRITKQQLEMLEDLFRLHSHPSREERQMLAVKTGMELRSVTIWLQNKRQLVKKNAKASAEARSSASTPSSAGSPESAPQRITASPSPEDDMTRAPLLPRPSLDRVASLSEYPSPVRPVNSKSSEETQPLWNHMPSSPPTSPPPPVSTKAVSRVRSSNGVLHKTSGRPYPPLSRTASVDSATTCVSSTSTSRQRDTERAKYIKPSLTLEWACAQAAKRQVKEDDATHAIEDNVMIQRSLSQASTVTEPEDVSASPDEMQAALALCGLLHS
ncbi:hypothetical protein FRB99_007710 [Tulasnella sp. 403]|nr:hypothetical protein FRB99_007710 [Tulasnella sp. 403]